LQLRLRLRCGNRGQERKGGKCHMGKGLHGVLHRSHAVPAERRQAEVTVIVRQPAPGVIAGAGGYVLAVFGGTGFLSAAE
jgi:hypothetical protein